MREQCDNASGAVPGLTRMRAARRRNFRAPRLSANTDPQRDSPFTKGPSDVLDHATSEIASGSKLGIDATKKIPGEGFKRAWPPLIKMEESVKAKIDSLFGNAGDKSGRKV